MKILESEFVSCPYHLVRSDDGSHYERYSAEDWRWCVGESTETVFDTRELEAAFQAFNQTSDV